MNTPRRSPLLAKLCAHCALLVVGIATPLAAQHPFSVEFAAGAELLGNGVPSSSAGSFASLAIDWRRTPTNGTWRLSVSRIHRPSSGVGVTLTAIEVGPLVDVTRGRPRVYLLGLLGVFEEDKDEQLSDGVFRSHASSPSASIGAGIRFPVGHISIGLETRIAQLEDQGITRHYVMPLALLVRTTY